jgi:hypothetical protein
MTARIQQLNTLFTQYSCEERRATYRLLSYWDGLRGARVMPEENDIDPEALSEVWDNCLLIQVRDIMKNDYIYTYLGPNIVNAYRGDLSEEDEMALASPNAAKLAFNYSAIIDTKKPIHTEGEFRNLTNDLIKYRQCLLPLGKNDRVEAILGEMRFRLIPHEGLR